MSEENKLLLPYHHTWKLSLHYLVNAQIFHLFHFFHAYWVGLPIRNTDELRKRCDMDWILHSMVDDAVDHWWKRLEAGIRAEGGYFEHLL